MPGDFCKTEQNVEEREFCEIIPRFCGPSSLCNCAGGLNWCFWGRSSVSSPPKSTELASFGVIFGVGVRRLENP